MSASVLVQIDRIYAGIPPVACKPDCGNCCGPILMTHIEWKRIEDRLGHAPAGESSLYLACDFATGNCSLLVDNKCSVYDIRPLVCRLYATGPSGLQCPHGCKSERRVSDVTADMKMKAIFRIGKKQ
jgi:uncharacterized protein